MPHPSNQTAVALRGEPLESAFGAVLMLHGRGATPDDILTLHPALDRASFAFVAPAATGRTWYPQSFMAPIAANEPYLSRSLEVVAATLETITQSGVPASRVILLGFSQGACLASEFVARNPTRYGGLAAFTGGLIGPAGSLPAYSGSLGGTPVFLGAGDPDAHVPWTRVEETAQILRDLDARVTLRRYPGMPHSINEDQIEAARALIIALENNAGDPA